MSTVIRCEHLSKYYKLGVINNGTFFRDMQTWIARKRGKEDPHSKIGDIHHYDATKEGFWALKDLDFDIKQGDRVGIIGKNGAGKSTLLKVLSRITAPTEGNVKIKGRVASLLEVGTGFHPELTGRENIYLNGAILGMKRREVTRKMDEIIAFSEIDKHIDTPVKRYSSGMYVKLAFSVAAHLDSEILIADEVLAVGDATFQKKALGKMNELSTGQGRTVLFVSHNMSAVKNLCNAGILLDHGSVIKHAGIDEAISGYMGVEDHENITEIKPWINPGKEYSPYFNPLRLAILSMDGSEQTKSLDYDKEYFLSLTFNVEKTNTLLLFDIFVYQNLQQVYQIKLENGLHTGVEEGKNVFKCKLPRNILIPGNSYRFVLQSAIHGVDYILFRDNFEVFIDAFMQEDIKQPFLQLIK